MSHRATRHSRLVPHHARALADNKVASTSVVNLRAVMLSLVVREWPQAP